MNSRTSCLMVIGIVGSFSIGNALVIKGDSPKMTIVDPVAAANPFVTEFRDNLNATLDSSFKASLDTTRNQLKGFKDLTNLAQGFANANAYSMNSATLQGFQNYSLFAVATGLMVGVQAPSTSLSYYSKVAGDIKENGNIYAGLGVGASFLNVGINAKFIMPGLYLNAKYGALDLDIDDFSMKFSVMGLGFNYRLLDTKSFVGLVKWRGISVGSGFYMQSDKINLLVKSDTVKNSAPLRAQLIGNSTGADSLARASFMDQIGYTKANPNADIALTPSFNMGLDVSTYTIPFDAVTSVSLLWGLFNLTAGAGVDLNFGSNTIILLGKSKATVSSDTTKATFSPANVSIDGTTDNGPSFARFRVMTGVGMGLGPVKFDIPLIYYPSSGVAFGLTAAVVW
jgi:hypothetical protein